MKHTSISAFLDRTAAALPKTPGALVFAEDQTEVASTLEHLLKLGFGTVALFAGPEIELPEALEPRVHRIPWDIHRDGAVMTAVNRVIETAPGAWLHYCYNAEYLFFPFCETRSIGDLDRKSVV